MEEAQARGRKDVLYIIAKPNTILKRTLAGVASSICATEGLYSASRRNDQ